MAIILGVATTAHDTSAALLIDGALVAAISEERLSRIKCDGKGIPERAIAEVLRIANVERTDVDRIAMTLGFIPEDYIRYRQRRKQHARALSLKWRKLKGRPSKLIEMASFLRTEEGIAELRARFDAELFAKRHGFRPGTPVTFFPHHQIHAILAGYYSGHDRCAVVTVDGVGDTDESHGSWIFERGRVQLIAETRGLVNSAGIFYENITKLLGFRPLRHEGKVLGLAAFGNPDSLYEDFKAALRHSDDRRTLCSALDTDTGAQPERFEYLKKLVAGNSREAVAAAAQKVLEDAIVPLVQRHVVDTALPHVAVNGGVFANVKLNQRISELAEVASVFVFPGMSDTGNSVGAALLDLAQVDPSALSRSRPLPDVYLGPEFTDSEIGKELEQMGLVGELLEPDDLIRRTAHAVHSGSVVGWFQGRMEFGPRALGNRSMIARPTDASINKSLNDRLERTEFMPFAPSVLVEAADEVFERAEKVMHSAEFMTVTLDVRKSWRPRIPAVVHVDGTARPQFVRHDRNHRYHRLISEYHKLSGIPLVLNTSFNAHEEPIVCNPAEAIHALIDDRIDALAIGNYWVPGQRG